MHYGAIKPCDIANGLGVRVSLFVSGCRHRCQNCFNPETWAFRYGQPYTEETTQQILNLLCGFFFHTLLSGVVAPSMA